MAKKNFRVDNRFPLRCIMIFFSLNISNVQNFSNRINRYLVRLKSCKQLCGGDMATRCFRSLALHSNIYFYINIENSLKTPNSCNLYKFLANELTSRCKQIEFYYTLKTEVVHTLNCLFNYRKHHLKHIRMEINDKNSTRVEQSKYSIFKIFEYSKWKRKEFSINCLSNMRNFNVRLCYSIGYRLCVSILFLRRFFFV